MSRVLKTHSDEQWQKAFMKDIQCKLSFLGISLKPTFHCCCDRQRLDKKVWIKNRTYRWCLYPRFSSFPVKTHYQISVILVGRTIACLGNERNVVDLYKLLGLRRTATSKDIRDAFLNHSKRIHPDVVKQTNNLSSTGVQQVEANFQRLKEAYEILKDPKLRKVYDTLGIEGVEALQKKYRQSGLSLNDDASSHSRTEHDTFIFSDYLAEDLGFDIPLLEQVIEQDEMNGVPLKDACPRSVEEAIHNILYHENVGYRYYALWWISKNRVIEAEDALIQVLETSQEKTAIGGYILRRRAAVALGNIASVKSIIPLTETLCTTEDRFLRHRCAEALATIARIQGPQHFPSSIIERLVNMIQRGMDSWKDLDENTWDKQRKLFQWEHLSPEVQQKLENIFKERMRKERQQQRMTQTPNLGVGQDSLKYPLEWLLKALGFLNASHHSSLVESFLNHPIPLVKYAAYKVLYQWSGNATYLKPLVEALQFGNEHHYTQRVIIRDLADVGYLEAATAIADCPMVESSFKLMALRRLAAHANYDVSLQHVVALLDSLDDLL
eukprot:jgi/Galph1/2784/GphlegSOOS_G1468.1